jgi:hypothetical protein
MGQQVRPVTCYVLFQRRRRRALIEDETTYDETTYEVWLFFVVRAEQDEATVPPSLLNPPLSANAAETVGEEVKKAFNETTADQLVGLVWKSDDDLSPDQIAALIADLPDRMRTLAGQPINDLVRAAGAPALVAANVAGTAATFALSPVLDPLERLLHGLEVVGVLAGLVTGHLAFAVFCAKHLAHDELGSVVADAFEQFPPPTFATRSGVMDRPETTRDLLRRAQGALDNPPSDLDPTNEIPSPRDGLGDLGPGLASL